MYYIKEDPSYGRGLYAQLDIEAGRLLTRCELLIFQSHETKIINLTSLKYYTFTYKDGQDCLVLGDGELFNHSYEPNVSYKIMEYDNRHVMEFYTLKPIKAGEQLFIDYSADTKVDVNDYKVNLY